jgi:hypothetical protein
VLRKYGVVEQPDGSVRLSPEYAALTGDDALISLDAVLDHHAMLSKLMRTGAEDPGLLPLSEDDALVIARAVGGRANDGTRAVYGEVLLPQLPELTEVLRNDRWLDVGCGVASATLTMATLYPEMNAVAIELVPTVAAETVRRAKAHGWPTASTSWPWMFGTWTRRRNSAGPSGRSRSSPNRPGRTRSP